MQLEIITKFNKKWDGDKINAAATEENVPFIFSPILVKLNYTEENWDHEKHFS